jgi:hypothetical protein
MFHASKDCSFETVNSIAHWLAPFAHNLEAPQVVIEAFPPGSERDVTKSRVTKIPINEKLNPDAESEGLIAKDAYKASRERVRFTEKPESF